MNSRIAVWSLVKEKGEFAYLFQVVRVKHEKGLGEDGGGSVCSGTSV